MKEEKIPVEQIEEVKNWWAIYLLVFIFLLLQIVFYTWITINYMYEYY